MVKPYIDSQVVKFVGSSGAGCILKHAREREDTVDTGVSELIIVYTAWATNAAHERVRRAITLGSRILDLKCETAPLRTSG